MYVPFFTHIHIHINPVSLQNFNKFYRRYICLSLFKVIFDVECTFDFSFSILSFFTIVHFKDCKIIKGKQHPRKFKKSTAKFVLSVCVYTFTYHIITDKTALKLDFGVSSFKPLYLNGIQRICALLERLLRVIYRSTCLPKWLNHLEAKFHGVRLQLEAVYTSKS